MGAEHDVHVVFDLNGVTWKVDCNAASISGYHRVDSIDRIGLKKLLAAMDSIATLNEAVRVIGGNLQKPVELPESERPIF
jgi:hypothetical protein